MKTLALLACVPLVFASDERETMSAMLRTRHSKAAAATSHTSEALAGKAQPVDSAVDSVFGKIDSVFGKKSHGKFCSFHSDCVMQQCCKFKCYEGKGKGAPGQWCGADHDKKADEDDKKADEDDKKADEDDKKAGKPPCFEGGVKYEPLGFKISDVKNAMDCRDKCVRASNSYEHAHVNGPNGQFYHHPCTSFSFYPDDKLCYIQQSGAKKVTENKNVISSKVVEMSRGNGKCDSSTRRATCGDSPSGSGLHLFCGPGAEYDSSKAASQCVGAECNGVVLPFLSREKSGYDHDTCCKQK